jgi:16S rRNA (guanine(966)-N(2))-methyltransferase RsmD
MRIIAGEKRGRKLVPWEETGIRPMRDFVRTALFNILADLVPGARFLDLFSGTGSVGLEALSRGAAQAVFVDSSPEACAIARRNLDALGLLDRGEVIETDFAEGVDRLERRGRNFDLAFIGPPYGDGLAEKALQLLGNGGLLASGAVVVTEVFKKESLPDACGRLRIADRRLYGDNALHFYRLDEEDPLASPTDASTMEERSRGAP